MEARRQAITKKMQLHKPFRECLGCGSLPKLGYDHGKYKEGGPKLGALMSVGDQYQAFTLYCPTCSFSVGPVMDLQAVISAWHTSNYPNCPFRLKCWQNRYQRQIENANTQVRETG